MKTSIISKLLLLTTAFLQSVCLAQNTLDSDYDGIPDEADLQPYINNIPKLLINADSVEFGISYSISGSGAIVKKQSFLIESTKTSKTEEAKKITSGESLTDKYSSNIAAGLSIGKEFLISPLPQPSE